MSTSICHWQSRLKQYGQSHLLRFADQLDAQQQGILVDQLTQIDWDALKELIGKQDIQIDWAQLAAQAEPPPAYRLNQENPQIAREAAEKAGQLALCEGKVAMILVAGGQGTRLGFDQPKGLFPIGPVSGRTLFQMHCDRLLGLCRRYQVQVPLYVMTSPATDQATRLYFQQQRGCGLAQGQMQIFCQGSMPAVDSTSGLVLLESPGSLALSPDGHGGMVAALKRNGCLDDMQRRGIQFIYYAQIDNPMARACDPELVGYHLLSGSQMTTQVVKKRFAREKVGNVVSIDGRVQIIEYSDLPDEIADQVDSQGLPRFWAGNIAIHVFDLDFLQQAVQSSTALPFHRAQKKVSCIDSQGRLVHPDQPNATKFERFIFDLLPIARRAIAVEQSAAEVFAPVKNANGAAVDTPFHTQQAILNQHRRWIEAAGSTIQTGVSVEISPLWALDAQEVSQRLDRPVHFSRDTFLV